jgi:hypothetical protein
MDKAFLPLIKNALAAAEAHGLQATLMQPEAPFAREADDATIEVTRGETTIRWQAEIKRAVTPATLGNTIHQLNLLGRQTLLITDYVTPPLAERLREQGIEFLDGAGNAYINQPNLFVWVKGQKPTTKPNAPETGRAFQPTGLQVVFAILCNSKNINLPYRELAEMAGAAHGTVGWVMADLQKLGYVRDLDGKRGTRRLFDPERLLPRWAEAYARQLRPRTLLARYYIPAVDGWKDWPIADYGALWGGEPAAALLTDYIRPGILTIYADKIPAMLVARHKLLKQPEPGHTAVVEIRHKFWDFFHDGPALPVVPPLLVYADLLATGDARCLETANVLYETYVARLFRQA